ncbi:MAG: LemA family protein [Candidatus Komeilibacteria bacterium RIFCSPLOWO2_02_FULL_48_11]|uniref:LemA family protein n=1 Tax=Candidatus Komeilibacteria bacterium RIFCSPLOWO2_02_FULL_48_11 TaxID=1798553 RepID=A0A1G2BS14_9BACT|nr:MAG: LemA family protein [Candidatus Komeilibacteria bacterium RIFCSPLOWO2_02_FULL_48_11]
MKKSWIILGVVVIIALWAWTGYNGLVKGDEAVKSQWANVENVYQRRFDLIPNIVATVKGAAAQDLDVFSKIADARARYSGARSIDDKAAAATEMEGALARLLVIVENYPTLKSQESFQALIIELEGTENRISVERMRYNEEVKSYNTMIRKFPRNVLVSAFGFSRHDLFEAAAGAEAAPQVDFTK